MRLRKRLFDLLGRPTRRRAPRPVPWRGSRDIVIIIDGTLSTLQPGFETNAGLAYRLLSKTSARQRAVYYEPGLQWRDWRDTLGVMTGHGINDQIRRAYGWLASQYRPGDRIYLIGYSRGAYAVRSLAGMVGRIGLLREEEATERNLRDIARLYRDLKSGDTVAAFATAHCHATTEIECVAVWDTVKALGIRLPVFWILADRLSGFHDHALGSHVRAGFHALALNETRGAYTPVLWETRKGWTGRIEQMWFRGNHGDIGGQLGGREWARPLANIPFVWLIERIQTAGLELPEGWRADFPRDPDAPSIGPLSGYGKFFWARWPRRVGRDPSEKVHPTAQSARNVGFLRRVFVRRSA